MAVKFLDEEKPRVVFLDEEPRPEREKSTMGASAISGALQGATFGWADEIFGLAMDALSKGDQYEQARDSYRKRDSQDRNDNPWTYGLSEVAGGMAIPGGAGVGGAKALNAGVKAVRPIGALAAAGATSGGIAGAGFSEGGTAKEVAGDAALGAGLGAVLSPAIAKGSESLMRGASNIAGGVRRKVLSTPQEQASMRVAKSLQDEGMYSVESIRSKLDALGTEGRLADIGPVLQQEAIRAAKNTGPGRKLAIDFVEKRQMGQESRLQKIARETVDPKWTDYRGYVRQIDAARKEQAREAYEAAYLQYVEPTEILTDLSQSNDYFKTAMEKAVKGVKNKVDVAMSAEEMVSDGKVSTRLMDQVMRELKDMKDAAFRSGNAELSKDIKDVRNLVKDEVFAQNPYLKRAMSIHQGGMEVKEAAQYGREMLTKKVRLDELADVMEDWSESEVDSMRVGMLQGIFDKLEDASDTQNSAARVINSSRVKKLLRETFKDEGRYQKFMDAIEAENTMQATRNKTVGGSPTYELTNGGQLPPFGGGAMQTAGNWLRHFWRKLGGEEAELSQLKSDDWNELTKYLFDDVDDATLQKLIAPTLRMRVKGSGVLDNTAGSFGISTSNMTGGMVADLTRD